MTELEVQIQVADYLRLRYPDVLFHSDYGSGLRLTPGQAIKQKRLQGGRRSWPDMFIAKPKLTMQDDMPIYMHGLFIELKKAGTHIYKRNGGLVADPHIREQAKMLRELEQTGYMAVFACGFDEAKEIIDEYLGGPKAEEAEF